MSFYDELLQQRPDAHLVAAMAAAASNAPKSRCRWWARWHRWFDGATVGKVATGRISYRQVSCKRCHLHAEVWANGDGRVWREDS